MRIAALIGLLALTGCTTQKEEHAVADRCGRNLLQSLGQGVEKINCMHIAYPSVYSCTAKLSNGQIETVQVDTMVCK